MCKQWSYCSFALSHQYDHAFEPFRCWNHKIFWTNRSVPYLLMPWLLALPCHLQPWCSLCRITHWDRAPHICVSKLTVICSDNGLVPGRRQTIIETNARILLLPGLKKIILDLCDYKSHFCKTGEYFWIVSQHAPQKHNMGTCSNVGSAIFSSSR